MDEFALDDIRVSANENPTPVELNLFRGSLNGQSVELFWQTITEINNYGFEVQKQAKGIEQSAKWETIGFIEGAGNSNAPKEYSFTDNLTQASYSYSYRLKQIDLDGSFTYSNEITVDAAVLPTELLLSQNYPNPFNPVTTIKYSIPESPLSRGVSEGRGVLATLKVYNLLGQEVATLVNQQQPAGNYEVKFDASKLASGVYLYKLQAGVFSSVKKLILMK
ncbi:MAG: T9SS type A sorting domain-containing protein [Ignavibacteria bacterium]|nr:T9SS type A sorting domain-containing protein [Ignavibacteria bacterium]